MATNPFLAVLASLFLVAPLGLALAADYQVRAFQREAFGHLAKAARYVRLMGWTIFVYYLGVLAGSFALGELQAMFEWPLSTAGAVVYIRIGAAILGYVMLNLVAGQLYQIVRPAGTPLRVVNER